MNRNSALIFKRVQSAWNDIRSIMQKMYPGTDIRPYGAYDVFSADPSSAPSEAKFLVNPVVFKVPERATHPVANLFVVVSGWLSFESADLRSGQLFTKSFGTRTGYFRAKNGILEHVYGAHYDIAEDALGHPVFHSQIAPQLDFAADTELRYRLQLDLQDKVGPILRGVRTPSAQMDVFSVIIQICADHLLHADSGIEVQNAFSALRESCDFFTGAAHRMSQLTSTRASSCYRSTHWYESLADFRRCCHNDETLINSDT